MLDVRDLSAAYGQHRALEGASLRVERGEIVVILGANGAGKSTLLKAICGICEGHVSGSITMNGHELVGEKPDRIVEQGIALVPEGRGIFSDLTVEENLMLGGYAPRARDEMANNLEGIYTLFPKLRERRKQVARTMSGGEQQMVAIGRAMMSMPTILALDEPSLGLAPVLCKELFQSLKAVRETGTGILLVEQNARASLAIADRGYLLENAHIIHEDSAEKLANDPAVQKAYLGGASKRPGAGISHGQVPMPVTPMPPAQLRPAAGPSPTDIAAAAMQSFSSSPPAPEPAPQPSPVAPATAPLKPMPAAAPSAPSIVAAPSSSSPHGIEIEALVAQAREISARQVTKASGSLPTQASHAGAPRQRRATTPVPMPDISGNDDRLKTMLAEIEAAALRARQRTPTNSGHQGRKF